MSALVRFSHGPSASTFLLRGIERKTGRPSILKATQPCGTSKLFHSTTRSHSVPMVQVFVNGKGVLVPGGSTVLQACEAAGVDVPRFCYHERLSIAGNCRMCLVEVEKSPKPVASCAMPVLGNMQIKTETEVVKKAREGVMEFLLANHPLDCPICDQGGECDLQDQSMYYGSDRSRYREWKRTVEDKNLGPLVKTVMTRCIHCTRCVRFAAEVAGVEELGTTGRGGSMEIGTYVEKFFDSEMSGNVIDLCPVGALTSKPAAFMARSWEYERTESVDVMDSVGSNIRIDTRGRNILRILPRLHEEVNEEWISDKSRFAYDGLKRQRLDVPLVKKGENEFVGTEWRDALYLLRDEFKRYKPTQLLALAGPLVDAEGLIALKDLWNRLNANDTRLAPATAFRPDVRSDYLFNSRIIGIEEADLLLLVGTNPRMEAPVINARIRKTVLHYGLKVASIGPSVDLAYESPIRELGNDLSVLFDVAQNKHPFASELQKAKRPIILIGSGAMQSEDGLGEGTLTAARQLVKAFPNLRQTGWNGVNFLHSAASAVAGLDIGFVPGPSVDTSKPISAKLVYLLGVDDEKTLSAIPKDAFVIYQGHHGDKGATRANVILPSAAYTEKAGIYVNTEGRPQTTEPATTPIGEAREDWQIIRALSEVLNVPLPYNDLQGVRNRLVDVAPHLRRLDKVESTSVVGLEYPLQGISASGSFSPVFDNFFMTDPISRASRVMAKCSRSLPKSRNSYRKSTEIQTKASPSS